MMDAPDIGPAVAAALAELAEGLPDGHMLDLAELRLDLAPDAGPDEIRRALRAALAAEGAA
jgi:hypothetical protein